MLKNAACVLLIEKLPISNSHNLWSLRPDLLQSSRADSTDVKVIYMCGCDCNVV